MENVSIVKMDKERKIKMLVGQVAIRIAKEKGDPLYDKYKKYRELYLETKRQIIEKYANRAKQVVRKYLKDNS